MDTRTQDWWQHQWTRRKVQAARQAGGAEPRCFGCPCPFHGWLIDVEADEGYSLMGESRYQFVDHEFAHRAVRGGKVEAKREAAMETKDEFAQGRAALEYDFVEEAVGAHPIKKVLLRQFEVGLLPGTPLVRGVEALQGYLAYHELVATPMVS